MQVVKALIANMWSKLPIGDRGTCKIGQQREKISVAFFTIINLLAASRSGLFSSPSFFFF